MESLTAGRKLVKKWSAELDEGGPDFLAATKITFTDLADKYEAAKLISAEYRGPEDKKVKVKGLRSTEGPKRWLKTVRHHFGDWPIQNITHADIEAFKNERLDVPVQLGDGTQKPREISTVNRELELLRAMFNSAVRYGWIRKSPFRAGDPLISKAIENRRERVLTPLEEIRLLASCGGEEAEVKFIQKPKQLEYVRSASEQSIEFTTKGGRRIRYDRSLSETKVVANKTERTIKYTRSNTDRLILKSLIITALDTAMRKGEMLKLTWSDVDFASKTIRVRAMNSKTERPRLIGMTPRVVEQLQWLYLRVSVNATNPSPDYLVFGIRNNFKRSWEAVRSAAKLHDVKFHDLRHTAITRLIQGGVETSEVMKISGHSQISTFLRYLNPNHEAVVRIADKLNAFNLAQRPSDPSLHDASGGLAS